MGRTRSAGRRAAIVLVAGLAAAARAAEPAPAVKADARTEALIDALAEARAEVDALRARLEGRAWQAAGGSAVPAPGRDAADAVWHVRAVNEALGAVVVDAGRAAGVRPGMRLAVVQGDRGVATVRVVDVRARVAGAVLERSTRAPRPGDRVVLLAGAGT